MSGGDQFTIDCLRIELEVLEDRIDNAIGYLLVPDDSYGLSAIGVADLLRILRGEDTDE